MDIKIKNCTFKKDLDNGGKVYDIEWTQADKDEVQKGQCFKEVVIEQTYKDIEITNSDFGLKVKFPKSGGNNYKGGGKPLDEYRLGSYAFSYSKDIIVARIVAGENYNDVIKDLPKIALSIFNGIKEHKI